MVKKFKIVGTVRGKTEQFSRDTLEDAIGIGENFDKATIYHRDESGKGWIPSKKCKEGICEDVPLDFQLKKARQLAMRGTQ